MLGSSDAHARLRKEEALEYRLLYAVSFGVFLAAAALARLFPSAARRNGGRSIVGEARAAASTCIPFAFMG